MQGVSFTCGVMSSVRCVFAKSNELMCVPIITINYIDIVRGWHLQSWIRAPIRWKYSKYLQIHTTHTVYSQQIKKHVTNHKYLRKSAQSEKKSRIWKKKVKSQQKKTKMWILNRDVNRDVTVNVTVKNSLPQRWHFTVELQWTSLSLDSFPIVSR